MGRKGNNNFDYMMERLAKVVELVTDYQVLTWDQVFTIAERWCMKDYQHHRDMAIQLEVEPVYLLWMALLYVEHPLLVGEGRGWLYGPMHSHAEIIQAELEGRDLPVPVRKNSLHSVDVERI